MNDPRASKSARNLACVASIPVPVRAEGIIKGPREGCTENGVTNFSPNFLRVPNVITPSHGPIFRLAGTGTLATQATRKQIISVRVCLGATD